MGADLSQKHCVPCEGGTLPLKPNQFIHLLAQVENWGVVEDRKIEREFKFKNFKGALNFVNKVGEIAESEGHHPNIYLHNWSRVKIELTTHAIKGLSENDFIMASKIDNLCGGQ